jgi:hypothetical protein
MEAEVLGIFNNSKQNNNWENFIKQFNKLNGKPKIKELNIKDDKIIIISEENKYFELDCDNNNFKITLISNADENNQTPKDKIRQDLEKVFTTYS